MRVEWDRLGQEQFDELCEALVRREHRHATVKVYDGGGGDGGRDVVVDDHGTVTIYQLKRFTGRIAARNPRRRPQVEDSLRAAARHSPDRWVLVVPTTLNQREHDWFDRLATTVPFKVTLWDRTALDDACARNNDLVVHHQLDANAWLVDTLRTLHAEQALLTGPDDLVDRVRRLGEHASWQDPDWRWDFALEDGTVLRTLKAKHAGAAERSPIIVKLDLLFGAGAGDADLADRWLAATGYGAPGTVALPAGTVRLLTVEGPPLVAGRHEHVRVDYSALPEALPHEPVRLRVLDPHGRVLHELHGRTDRWGRGAVGRHVSCSVGGLVLGLRLDAGPDPAGQAQVDVDLSRCDRPEQALDAVRAMLELRPPNVLDLSVPPLQIRVDVPPDGLLDAEALLRCEQVMQDLVDVGAALDLPMPVPARLSASEVRDLRLAALLVRGETVEVHEGPMTATLSGADSPVLRRILRGEEKGAFVMRHDAEVEIAGRTLRLGQVAVWAGGTEVTVTPQTLRALARGRGAGRTFTINPAGGEPWRGKLVADLADVDLSQRPVPLGLVG